MIFSDDFPARSCKMKLIGGEATEGRSVFLASHRASIAAGRSIFPTGDGDGDAKSGETTSLKPLSKNLNRWGGRKG